MSFFLFMKNVFAGCSCWAPPPVFAFVCLPVATVPKAGIPERTSCILAGPKLTVPKRFLPDCSCHPKDTEKRYTRLWSISRNGYSGSPVRRRAAVLHFPPEPNA
jgi:hypothetical protein